MSLNETKVLMLNVNRTGWHSGNMIYDMEVFKKACDTTIYGPGWDNYKHTDIRKIIEQIYGEGVPDVIYTYFTPNERVGEIYINHYKIPQNLWNFPTGMDSLTEGKYKNIKRAFAVSDFWARTPEKWANDLKGSNFQFCFSCFAPPFSKREDFFKFLNPQVMGYPAYIALPRCVDSKCFRDYGQKREDDIITLGSMCNFYKFRRWMHTKLESHCLSGKIRYRNYSHCGTDWRHSGFVREEYAQAINRASALASCGGKFHLYFNKIFESWGCNTAYIGEMPIGHEELYVEDGKNFIAVNYENFIEKVDYYMDHKDELKEVAKAGQETFLKYHTVDVRAADLVKIMGQIS